MVCVCVWSIDSVYKHKHYVSRIHVYRDFPVATKNHGNALLHWYLSERLTSCPNRPTSHVIQKLVVLISGGVDCEHGTRYDWHSEETPVQLQNKYRNWKLSQLLLLVALQGLKFTYGWLTGMWYPLEMLVCHLITSLKMSLLLKLVTPLLVLYIYFGMTSYPLDQSEPLFLGPSYLATSMNVEFWITRNVVHVKWNLNILRTERSVLIIVVEIQRKSHEKSYRNGWRVRGCQWRRSHSFRHSET